MNEAILELLGKRRLKGMAEVFRKMLTRAQQEGWGHQQFIDQLFREEFLHRRERIVQYRLNPIF